MGQACEKEWSQACDSRDFLNAFYQIVQHKQQFNSRGQVWDMRLSTVSFAVDPWNDDRGSITNYYSNGSGADNNGNVVRQEQMVPTFSGAHYRQQDYAYDSLNRLKSVTEGVTYKQAFNYDRYGNRTIDAAETFNAPEPQFNTSAMAAQNRLYSPGETDTGSCPTTRLMCYDAAGNLTRDKHVTNAARMYYDAENRFQHHIRDDLQSPTIDYFYDADGKRKMTDNASSVTKFVYGLGGELLYEKVGKKKQPTEYVYRNGQLLVRAIVTGYQTADIKWLVTDHLGTPRMIADKTGNLSAMKRHDYLPFGEEIGLGVGGRDASQGYGPPQSDGVRQQFTGYERDSETDLDFAQARYFGSSLGRFTSTDPLEASGLLTDPQTLNRYAYVSNNPMNAVDPTGMSMCSAEYSYEQCGGEAGFWGGEFGDHVGYNSQTLGNLRPDVQASLSTHLERVNNSAGGMGFRTNSEVEGEAVVAMFKIFYDIYDDGSEGNARFYNGAITVYQWMPRGWQIFHILKDVVAPIQELSTPGLSNATNSISQGLWGTNFVDTDSVGYQDAENVTMVAGMVLPGPGGKAKAGKLAWKLAIHGAHHKFPRLGQKLAHVQLTTWRVGVKGSQQHRRIPLPSRKNFQDIIILQWP